MATHISHFSYFHCSKLWFLLFADSLYTKRFIILLWLHHLTFSGTFRLTFGKNNQQKYKTYILANLTLISRQYFKIDDLDPVIGNI